MRLSVISSNRDVALFYEGGEKMTKASVNLRKITISAVFLSVALVLKTYLTFFIPIFGENGMRIGFSGIFSIMPAILFGPVYGAIVSALSDILGYFLKPVGAYMPLMTLTAALGGFTRGFIWMAIRKTKIKNMRIAIFSIMALALFFGIWNIISLNSDGINASFYQNSGIDEIVVNQKHFISRLLITRTVSTSNPGQNLATYITFTTLGPIGFAVFGFILIIADVIILKKSGPDTRTNVMQILLAILISGMLVTTLNTVILREFMFESWRLLPFTAVWLPRAVEELVSGVINAYFIAALYGLLVKHSGLKVLSE